MKYLRILVCGGRDFGLVPPDLINGTPAHARAVLKAEQQRFLLKRKLNDLTIDEGDMLPRRGTTIIHGGAEGADKWADEWAVVNWCQFEVFEVTPEEWKRLGKKAGPLRNQRMLREGRPEVVLAFPTGGPGTANMMMLARAQGLPVIEVDTCES